MAALALMLGWAHPHPDERVLYQSRADDRGVCRPALRLPGAVTHYGWLTAGHTPKRYWALMKCCWGHRGGVPGDMVYLLPSFIFTVY
jgi:hypothetical protein